ncbi:MAG: hypothetical protein ACYC66_10425 [Chloroflexota bacterium]
MANRGKKPGKPAEAPQGSPDLPVVDLVRLGGVEVRVPDSVTLAERPEDGGPKDGEDYPYLVFKFRGNGEGRYEDHRGSLDQFIRLHDAPKDQVLEFARRWGPLGLCKAHARPCTHSGPQTCPLHVEDRAGKDRPKWGPGSRSHLWWLPDTPLNAVNEAEPEERSAEADEPAGGTEVPEMDAGFLFSEGRYRFRETKDGYVGRTYPVMGKRIEKGGIYFEPLDAWYRYASHLRAIMAVWGSLQSGQPGELKDWQAMSEAEADAVQPPEKRRFLEAEFHEFVGQPYDQVERD